MSPRLRYVSTTLALVAVGLGYAVIQGRAARPAPRIEARPVVARPLAPPLPTAREILDRGTDLALTNDQRARLEALDQQWKKEPAGVQVAVQEAERELTQFMQAQASGKTSLQEIQRRSADYRELSAELRELRQRHAEAAAHILTESQQRTLVLLTSPQTRGGVR